MSSTPRTSEQQFDKDFEQYQVELHACPSPVRQELNESFAARVQAGQGKGTTGFDNPDYVLVRASDLRRVDLYLSVAIDRAKYSIGRTQAVQARNELLRIQSSMVAMDTLLQRCRLEQGA